jgi:hypothetical protein
MNKKILNYRYEAHRIMYGFYPNCDTLDNINYNDYAIIISNRDNVQNEFDKIIKYANIDTKFILDNELI